MSLKLKETILQAASLYVHKSGFSQNSLNHAVTLLQLSPASHRIIDRGPIELVQFVMNGIYQNVLNSLYTDDSVSHLSFDENLVNALHLYIKEVSIYKNYWHEAMALQLLPRNIVQSYQELRDHS